MAFVTAFIVGGAICALCQLVMDYFKLTPAQVLVGLTVLGAILGGLGLYQPFAKWAGAGALVPVSGFGSSIVKGVLQDVEKLGWEGLFTGTFRLTSLGLAAAVVFGAISAVFVRPKR